MGFDFADAKALLRRTVHSTFSVAAIYRAPNSNVDAELAVRFHTKLGVTEAEEVSYIEGVTQIVFDREELALKSIVPIRSGKITLVKYAIKFDLQTAEPITGPVDLTWNVTYAGKPEA